MSVKLVLLKSGEDVIADFQEMIAGDDQVVGYLASYPYVVKINRTEVPQEEPDEPAKVGLSFFPWMPLSQDKNIPIDPTWIVTMVEPVEQVKESYEEKVNVIKEKCATSGSDEREDTAVTD